MFRLMQIDPESLALHINADIISKHKNAKQYFDLIDSLSLTSPQNVISKLKLDSKLNTNPSIIDFATSYLHELRHYADLLITPYGFYRIKTAFEFYFSLPYLLREGKNIKTPIPLISGEDPINRRILNIEGFEKEVEYHLIKTLLTRSRIIADNNVGIPSDHYFPTPTGDKILEALAFIQQFDISFNEFDIDVLKKHFPQHFSDYTNSNFDSIYRWFIPYIYLIHKNEDRPNNRLLFVILFASLCGTIPRKSSLQNWEEISEKKKRGESTLHRDISYFLPDNRFASLVEYFANRNVPSINSDDEAYFLVDNACVELFGKSIKAEIKLDIDISEEIYSQYRLNVSDDNYLGKLVLSAFSDLIECRKKVFSIFEETPTYYASIFNFYRHGSENLKPSIIYNIPSGLNIEENINFSNIRRNWVALIDNKYEIPIRQNKLTIGYAFWSPLPHENGYPKGIERSVVNLDGEEKHVGVFKNITLAGRQHLYAFFAPLYKQFLYSKQYKTMNEAEAAFLFEAFDPNNKKFILDPFFDRYNSIESSHNYFRFFEYEKTVCNICSKEIIENDSMVVSGGTIRQSKLLNDLYYSISPQFHFQLFKIDWSLWLICKGCLGEYKIG